VRANQEGSKRMGEVVNLPMWRGASLALARRIRKGLKRDYDGALAEAALDQLLRMLGDVGEERDRLRRDGTSMPAEGSGE
jgi:hypothetical protein